MPVHPSVTGQKPDAESDLVWGSDGIGLVINRTPEQVIRLWASGALDGAVGKLGHKTLVGSRSKLQNLPFLKRK
jgi:hypothetical protein